MKSSDHLFLIREDVHFWTFLGVARGYKLQGSGMEVSKIPGSFTEGFDGWTGHLGEV